MTDIGLYQLLDRREDADGVVETFTSTKHVESLWGPIQHGGPIAALLTRAMDRSTERPESRLTRVTIDILGPVPISEVRVRAQVVRPGKKIELISSVLEAPAPDGSWREYALGSAWRQATQPTRDVVNHANARRTMPTASSDFGEGIFPDDWMTVGFVSALDVRGGRVGKVEGEHSMAWIKLQQELVAGEVISPLEHLMAIADTTNGVGMRLNPAEFRFLNTEMTVHLYEAPELDWLGIEAETSVGSDGVGMSASVLHMPSGPIGQVAQSVLVERV